MFQIKDEFFEVKQALGKGEEVYVIKAKALKKTPASPRWI